MALQFDGVSQNVIVSSDAGVTGGTITLSIWVKLASEISSGSWCFFLQRDYSTQVKYAIYYDYNGGTRRLKFQRTRYSIVDDSSYYETTLGTSDWYHLVLTYDNSNVRGYKNGVLVAGPTASTGNGSISSTHPDNVFIGSEETARFSNAVLYDARVYNRALSANEIAEIYHHRGADKVWQGLVGRWRLDEAPGGTPAPLLIDSMDSTTGLVASYGSVSLNTTTYREGSGALSLSKTSTTEDWARMDKTISAVDLTDQTINLWVYIKDSTVLSKMTVISYFFGQGVSNRYRKAITSLVVGWQLLSTHVDDFSVWAGSPTKTNVTFLAIGFDVVNNSTTLATNDVIFDFFHAGDYTSDYIIDGSGNGNHGAPQGGVYRDSPHRLRRGVLVS